MGGVFSGMGVGTAAEWIHRPMVRGCVGPVLPPAPWEFRQVKGGATVTKTVATQGNGGVLVGKKVSTQGKYSNTVSSKAVSTQDKGGVLVANIVATQGKGGVLVVNTVAAQGRDIVFKCSDNTRQRRCLSHKDSGSTRQRRHVTSARLPARPLPGADKYRQTGRDERHMSSMRTQRKHARKALSLLTRACSARESSAGPGRVSRNEHRATNGGERRWQGKDSKRQQFGQQFRPAPVKCSDWRCTRTVKGSA